MKRPPLPVLTDAAYKDLAAMLLQGPSAFVLWGAAHRSETLDLALGSAQGRVRTYLLGPASLGDDLLQRARLKQHAHRLLARRAVTAAADLLIAGRGQDGALLLHDMHKSYVLRLPQAHAAAAFAWFCHLFWHHAQEEGWASPRGYRFLRPGPPLFEAEAPSEEAPVWLRRAACPDAAERTLYEDRGDLWATAPRADAWSLRVRL